MARKKLKSVPRWDRIGRKGEFDGGRQYRPMLHWPYSRHSHLGFMDDAYFWGFTDIRVFHNMWSEPLDGWLTKLGRRFRSRFLRSTRRSRRMFSKPYYRSTHPKQPDALELIHYRVRDNRDLPWLFADAAPSLVRARPVVCLVLVDLEAAEHE